MTRAVLDKGWLGARRVRHELMVLQRQPMRCERSDITMPANFTALLDTLQRLAPKALFQTVRFEALPVVQQLRLVCVGEEPCLTEERSRNQF